MDRDSPVTPAPTPRNLPPKVVGSPSELPRADEEVAWWRPTFMSSMRHLGWRWIYLLPALLLLLTPAAAVLFPGFRGLILVGGAKLPIFGVAIAIGLAAHALRQAAQARTNPFCIHCGYDLSGLPDHYRCPECGRPYAWNVIAEYRRNPTWFIERWNARHKLPQPPSAVAAGPVRRKRRAKDGTE